MKNILIILLILPTLFSFEKSVGQGLNHTFLLGYDIALFDTNVTSTKARLNFDSVSVTAIPQTFKMPFRAAQANISDQNGNLLMYTNGCWIADATGDTMQNGGGLNPGPFTSSWCGASIGIPDIYSSIILPWPGDSTKYILFHQTGNFNIPNSNSSELYYSVIDITLNGGLGAVTQKNQIAFQDSLSPGMTACKHANGRDWWIVILKDNSDILYKILLTPSGITNITNQHLGMPPHNNYNGQPQFSPDGTKIVFAKMNDLYLYDIVTKNTIQITTDGKKNSIINGITDWVYEEEFAFVRAFDWSADSKKLAFIRFDESEVPEFSMSIYHKDLYPTVETFKYPKAGEKNATVRTSRRWSYWPNSWTQRFCLAEG